MKFLIFFTSIVLAFKEFIGKGLIQGTTSLFNKLDKRGEIGVFIFYNSLNPEIKCQICKPFEDRLMRLIHLYKSKPNAVFARMDLKDTREVYARRKIESVPTFEFYPPCNAKGCPPPVTFQTHLKGPNEEAINDFIEDFIGPLPKGRRAFYMLIGSLLIGGIFVFYNFEFTQSVISNKWTWTIGSFVMSKINSLGYSTDNDVWIYVVQDQTASSLSKGAEW